MNKLERWGTAGWVSWLSLSDSRGIFSSASYSTMLNCCTLFWFLFFIFYVIVCCWCWRTYKILPPGLEGGLQRNKKKQKKTLISYTSSSSYCRGLPRAVPFRRKRNQAIIKKLKKKKSFASFDYRQAWRRLVIDERNGGRCIRNALADNYSFLSGSITSIRATRDLIWLFHFFYFKKFWLFLI